MSGPNEPSNPDEQWAGPQGPGATPDEQRDDATRTFGIPQQNPADPRWGQQPPPAQQQWGQQQGQPPYPPQQQWSGQPPGYQPPGQQWGQDPQAPGQQWPPQQPPPGQQQWGPQQPWGPQPAGVQPDGTQQHPQYQGALPVSTAKRKSKLPLFIGLGVLALIVAGVVLLLVHVLSYNKLDRNAAQDGVTQVLGDSYGVENITEVKCPSDQRIKKGNTFTCTLKVDGEAKTVIVTFTDDDRTYEVGRPS